VVGAVPAFAEDGTLLRFVPGPFGYQPSLYRRLYAGIIATRNLPAPIKYKEDEEFLSYYRNRPPGLIIESEAKYKRGIRISTYLPSFQFSQMAFPY
jgi:hypothetical protein